jgi:TetR/AcrR family transcriptional repressor of nem operon
MKPECDTKCKLLRVAGQLLWENSYGSVSVDDICKRADAKKGSFYYFFPSKSDLAVAAMEADWQEKIARYDLMFSAQAPALERIERYCASTYECQKAKWEHYGKVCGCPAMTLGSELSTQDEKIRLKAVEIMHRYVKYLESALRDAAAEGVIQTGDPHALAEELFCYNQGVLLQAKMRNDLAPLLEMKAGMFRLMQVQTEAVAR